MTMLSFQTQMLWNSKIPKRWIFMFPGYTCNRSHSMLGRRLLNLPLYQYFSILQNGSDHLHHDVINYIRGRNHQTIIHNNEPQLTRVNERWRVWADWLRHKSKEGSWLFADVTLTVTDFQLLRSCPGGHAMPCLSAPGITPENNILHLGVFSLRQLIFMCQIDRTLEWREPGCNAPEAAVGRGAAERHLLMLYEALVLSVISFV